MHKLSEVSQLNLNICELSPRNPSVCGESINPPFVLLLFQYHCPEKSTPSNPIYNSINTTAQHITTSNSNPVHFSNQFHSILNRSLTTLHFCFQSFKKVFLNFTSPNLRFIWLLLKPWVFQSEISVCARTDWQTELIQCIGGWTPFIWGNNYV